MSINQKCGNNGRKKMALGRHNDYNKQGWRVVPTVRAALDQSHGPGGRGHRGWPKIGFIGPVIKA